MATKVWTDAYLKINSVDLTDHCRGISLTYQSEMIEDTVFNASSRTKKPGYKSWSVTAQMEQDFAAGKVDATLFPLVGSTAAFPIEIRPSSAVMASDNPTFSGSVVLESYNPMAGGVGELMMTPVVFQSAGALTRTTA